MSQVGGPKEGVAYPCHGKTERFTLRLGQHPDVVLAALAAAALIAPRRRRKAAVDRVRGRRVRNDFRATYQAWKPWGARGGEGKGRGSAAGHTGIGTWRWRRLLQLFGNDRLVRCATPGCTAPGLDERTAGELKSIKDA